VKKAYSTLVAKIGLGFLATVAMAQSTYAYDSNLEPVYCVLYKGVFTCPQEDGSNDTYNVNEGGTALRQNSNAARANSNSARAESMNLIKDGGTVFGTGGGQH